MRAPFQKWITDHLEFNRIIDELVIFLDFPDISTRLCNPDEAILRSNIAETLQKIINFTNIHNRLEDKLLIPVMDKYVVGKVPNFENFLNGMVREHEQFRLFADRAGKSFELFKSDDELEPSAVSETIRLAFGIQALVKLHFKREEIDIFPNADKLPADVVIEIMDEIEKDSA